MRSRLCDWVLGLSLVLALSLNPCPSPATTRQGPDLCQIQREWSSTVDGRPALLVELACKRQGSLSLVLFR